MSLVVGAAVILIVLLVLIMKGYKRSLTEKIRRETLGSGPTQPTVADPVVVQPVEVNTIGTINAEAAPEPIQSTLVETPKAKATARRSTK
jgi:hypothetical protein